MQAAVGPRRRRTSQCGVSLSVTRTHHPPHAWMPQTAPPPPAYRGVSRRAPALARPDVDVPTTFFRILSSRVAPGPSSHSMLTGMLYRGTRPRSESRRGSTCIPRSGTGRGSCKTSMTVGRPGATGAAAEKGAAEEGTGEGGRNCSTGRTRRCPCRSKSSDHRSSGGCTRNRPRRNNPSTTAAVASAAAAAASARPSPA